MKVNPYAVYREEMDGSAIVFDAENDKILSLNSTGKCIWKALADAKGPDEIAAILVDEFDGVELAQAKENVKDFIDRLAALGLVVKED